MSICKSVEKRGGGRERGKRERMKLYILIFVGRVIFLGDYDHTHELSPDGKQMAVSGYRTCGDHMMQGPQDGPRAFPGHGRV